MIFIGVTTALVGLVVGSFVTTAALRATRGEQAFVGRSACDHCGLGLSYAATVPVVSYILQRGSCSACRGEIDPIHPLGEVSVAIMTTSAFLLLSPLPALLAAGLGMTLLASSVVDAKTRRLPDLLTLVVAAFCLALAAMRGTEALLVGALASTICFAVLTALRAFAGKGGRDPSLGFGDVKLICALALWLGAAAPWAIVVAAVIGLASVAVLRPRDRRISFGPALAAGGWGVGLMVQASLWPA